MNKTHKTASQSVMTGKKAVQVVRKCPHCGRTFYEKLSKCYGTIGIICQRCGRHVQVNLALRRTWL